MVVLLYSDGQVVSCSCNTLYCIQYIIYQNKLVCKSFWQKIQRLLPDRYSYVKNNVDAIRDDLVLMVAGEGGKLIFIRSGKMVTH